MVLLTEWFFVNQISFLYGIAINHLEAPLFLRMFKIETIKSVQNEEFVKFVQLEDK